MADEKQYALIEAGLARDMLSYVRQLKERGMLNGTFKQPEFNARLIEEPIHFRNDSGEEIPRYACMQVVGTVDLTERNVLLVDKPADVTAEAGAYLFNGHYAVAIDAIGTAQKGRQVRAVMDTGGVAVAGVRWGPIVSSWKIEEVLDGLFVMAGADAIIADGCKIFIDGGCC